MRLKSILGWSWFVILCVIYSLLASAYGFLLWNIRGPSISPIAVASLPLLLISCGLIIARFCHRRGLDRSGYWRSALLVLLCVPVVWLMTDAKPIEQDYSIADTVSTDPEVLKSYDDLMLLRKETGLKVDGGILANNIADILSLECTNAVVHSNIINRAWDNTAEARSVIERLDSYKGITDITPNVKLSTNITVISFLTLRNVCLSYAAYARLKTAEGKPEEAARQLAKLHRVTRKALPNAGIFFDKMVWVKVGKLNMESAVAILRDSHCTPETVEILNEAFPPIPKADVNLRRTLIFEYVWMKYICEIELRPSNFMDALVMHEIGTPQKPSSFLRKVVSSLAYHLTFRKHRTVRDIRNFYDSAIEGAGNWPPDLSGTEPVYLNYCVHPDIQNLGGWNIVHLSVPSFIPASETAVKMKVLSDLLFIEIGDRLNQAIILDDCYVGTPYARDKLTGRAVSVGPDKKLSTPDDIVLGKNQDSRQEHP